MAGYDFRRIRLYVEAGLASGTTVTLDRAQAHYLTAVMRLTSGRRILVFNGRDGEWEATVEAAKRSATLHIGERTRVQPEPCDLHYLFAPLKAARLDYMVQKAVEMGAARLQPVLTAHSQVSRINLARMEANAVEAAEQCGILTLPEISPPCDFDRLLAERDPDRLLVFCDEDAETRDPISALAPHRAATGPTPVDVLVGPEGGFADRERAALLAVPNSVRLALGPRILRADTAAVAALALVGAVLGDWRPD
jgi:16S rRNA (uracil1498-N3)-methyltransferase